MEEKKMEGMLSQLIGMVGNMREDLVGVKAEISTIKEDLQEVKDELQGVKADLQGVKEEQQKMKELNEIRHKEIMDKFNLLAIDQDITWDKTSQNEREIAKLKKLLEV